MSGFVCVPAKVPVAGVFTGMIWFVRVLQAYAPQVGVAVLVTDGECFAVGIKCELVGDLAVRVLAVADDVVGR